MSLPPPKKKSMKHQKRQKKMCKKATRQKTVNEITIVSPSPPLITLKVNELDFTVIRHRGVKWIFKKAKLYAV